MWEDDDIQIQSRSSPIPGRDLEADGITPYTDLASDDLHMFNKYKEVITELIREEPDLHFPDDFEFFPTSVARQIESSKNCYFRIDLPHCIMTVKIIPHPHASDLRNDVTIHRENFVGREPSITELIL
ncbi:unnamed protein product [Adineta steineri]|uniref:Uncharacterized protein n=1 Tax=Adineta steineri TaxID=433720 RepID=A0A814KMX5_9BILA|nr:unnamed protein product [Adineta steineri]CAF1166113.1 unnamed protein product [Adineta steineri]CAF1351733.1 unnamed protein product [Adineta steineri]